MPILPLPQSQRSWSIAIRTAYQRLYQIYQTGYSYVSSESVESHRLQQYGQAIITDAYPLLLLLSDTPESEQLPSQWIEEVSTEFTTLLALIDEQWMSAKHEDRYIKSPTARNNLKKNISRSATNISIPQPVHAAGLRKRGRPRKNIDPMVLHEAFQHKL